MGTTLRYATARYLPPLGQYHVYRLILAQDDPQRHLYLAIAESTYAGIFCEPLGQLILHERSMRIMVFDPSQEAIVQWTT